VSTLWTKLGVVNGSAVDDKFLTSDAQLVLLKFVDGMVHTAGNIDLCLLEGCVAIMRELVKTSVSRLFNVPESFGEGPIECLTSSTRLLLDVFQTAFTAPRPLEPGTNGYTDLSEILLGISL
jgi:hypothetical protein